MNIINANLHAILFKPYAQSELQHLIKAALLGEEDLGSLSDGDFDDLPCKKKACDIPGENAVCADKKASVKASSASVSAPGSSVRTPHE